MTNRRSLQTDAMRSSRAFQFVPGHVGGRVASAQPVTRRKLVGAVQGLPPDLPTSALLRTAITSFDPVGLDMEGAQIIWAQGGVGDGAAPAGFAEAPGSGASVGAGFVVQVFTCNGWATGMGSALTGTVWGSILVATKGGSGGMWGVDIYDATQHYNPTEGPVFLKSSLAPMSLQCLAGANWYSWWRDSCGFDAMAGGRAQFPISPPSYGWAEPTALLNRTQYDGYFHHTDIGVYGDPRSISFNLEWS